MDEYLQYMKTLRSQINDVEDQAAKISAEEQIHFTTIQTFQTDLLSAQSETKRLRDDTEKKLKEKGQICSQILAKQRKIASLESDSSTLTQTLELMQQEKISLSSKLILKSSYYSEVAKELSTKLQQQQDWVKSQNVSRTAEENGLVNKCHDTQMTESEVIAWNQNNEAGNGLIVKLDLAKAKLDGIAQMKAKLVSDNAKVKESIEQARCKASNFKPELLSISTMTLEEEYNALLQDKDGEAEYLCSLQNQIEQIKGISHVIKCGCGEEYRVNLRA